jgi:hypothetical protein
VEVFSRSDVVRHFKTRHPMKIIYLTFALILFISCNNSTNTQTQQETFESTEFVFSNFSKNDFIKKPYGSVYSYSYVTNGSLQNNTKNFYSSTFITTEIRIILENGNEMTNKDIDPNPMFFGDLGGMISGEWEPNENAKVELETPRMTETYLKYPIKKIFIDYIIKTTDKINKNERYEVFKTIEVTEKWKKLMSK